MNTALTMQAAMTALAAQDSLYGVEAARAHAAHYADPNHYTQPAVVDIWQDFFLGRPTMQTNPAYNDGTVEQTLVCPPGFCSGQTAAICIGPFANNCASTGSCGPLSVGDVFYLGKLGTDGAVINTPDGNVSRTHLIVAANGSCPGGTSYTVYPWIDYATEPHADGEPVSQAWRHEFHPSNGAAYLIGYKLGSDTRDKWGAQGHNLIVNPGFQEGVNQAVNGWTITTGSLDSLPYDIGINSMLPTPGGVCNSGEGVGYQTGITGGDCVVTSAPQDAEVVQTDPIPVVAGEQYILSGLISTGSTIAYYGLADDRDLDGVWTLSNDMKISLTESEVTTNMNVVPRWFSSAVTIPAGVEAVKFLYHSASSSDWLDFVSMRKQTALVDSNVATNYLINDPGSRNIMLMGDSWLDAINPYGGYVKKGVIDSLNQRLGTCLGGANSGLRCTLATQAVDCPASSCSLTTPIGPGQVILAGHGGDTTAGILAALPGRLAGKSCTVDGAICSVDGDCGANGPCVPIRPLYIVLDGGINDAIGGVAYTTTLANLKEMARLSVQAGAIPVILSPPPVAQIDGVPVYGTESVFAKMHTLREGLRNWAFGLDDGCGAATDNEVFATCGVGACLRTALSCVGGVTQQCTPGEPSLELCNGIDDDCDGAVDNAVAPGILTTVTMAKQVDGSSSLNWSISIVAQTYDVTRGSLDALRSTAGDFTSSTNLCLGNDTAATTVVDAAVPQESTGYWYLVRGSNCAGAGTYDDPAGSQAGPRDAAIAASASACP